MRRLTAAIVTTAVLGLALGGCEGGGIGMVGSPAWNMSTSPAEKHQYVTRAYRQIRETNVSRTEAFNFCNDNAASAGAVAQMQAQPQAASDCQPAMS